MHLIGPVAASFSLCLLAMVALRPVAIAIDLIDRPSGRKSHVGDVPVVGGLGMLLGIILGLGLLDLPEPVAGRLLAASAILVTVGLIDDRFDLSPWARLTAQITAAVVLISSGAVLAALGAPFGIAIHLEGTASYVFTVFMVVAAVNAFNMLDGMDGLAGTLAMVALGALALLAGISGQHIALSIAAVAMGAVAAFLLSNLPINMNRDVRCFMGDSGSTLLGFLVSWLCIVVSQGSMAADISPVTMLWVVAIPLYELCWTVIRRSIRGIPPFRSDQGHLHHRVQEAGLGVRATFLLFFVVATVLAAFGIGIDLLGIPDLWSLVLLIATGALVIRLLYCPDLLIKLVPRSLRTGDPVVTD